MGVSYVTVNIGAVKCSESTAIAQASGVPSFPPGTGANHGERSMGEQRVVEMKEASHTTNSALV